MSARRIQDAAELKKQIRIQSEPHCIYEAGKQDGLTSEGKSGIVDIIEMYRKSDPIKRTSKPIGRERLFQVTIPARKRGMNVVVCEPGDELYEHLASENATASSIGSFVIFRHDATISEVLEEMRHFEQNLENLNSDKPNKLRVILNEIDARKYILNNAVKYSVPRVEIADIMESLEKYEKMLRDYEMEQGNYEN